MEIIVCLDDRDGMAFNHRRQSSDMVVTEDICARAGGAPLYLRAYSLPLFKDRDVETVAVDDFSQAPADARCFVEDQPLSPLAEKIDILCIYRWNRHYPADLRFDLALADGWQLVESADFAGHSHEIITREVYHR